MHELVDYLRMKGFEPVGDLPSGLRIADVTEVSGECGTGSLFVAVKGFKTDGHRYLADAAARGARAALVTDRGVAAPEGMALIRVRDTRRALGPLAQRVAGDPSHELRLFGVTGTNGKTTTVYLMESIFKAAGLKAGIMTTVVNRWGGKEVAAEETTPSGAKIARRLAEMLGQGVEAVGMEVSSHAIDQHRVEGLKFVAAALTNVTQDHLDYHSSMAEYAATKVALFERLTEENPSAIGVTNVDDATGRRVAELLAPRNRITYGAEALEADLKAESIRTTKRGLELELDFRGQKFSIATELKGRFNAMNVLTAVGLALAGGLGVKEIARGCARFGGAPGRFELIGGLPGVHVIVDYAHTPDALAKLLVNARPFAHARLIAVMGCGGDRDRAKRPLMGKAAAQLADEVIVTNDNPRTEDPESIAAQIVEGIRELAGAAQYRTILDRRTAIGAALGGAMPGDAVVIAGKGHEDYQIMGSKKLHFDDREVAREAIAALS